MGGFARRGGVGDQGADTAARRAGIHGRQTTAHAFAAGRGGITAGIEDEDVEASVVLAVATHSVQDVARVDRLVGQLFRL